MELAPQWEIGTVLDALQSKNRLQLAQFIKDRYETRFFEPICFDVRDKIAQWKRDYNETRPHGSLQYQLVVALRIAHGIHDDIDKFAIRSTLLRGLFREN
jgi:Integrase core domain